MRFLRYAALLFIGVLAFSFSSSNVFASGSCASNGVGTSWNTAADWTGTCSGAGGIPGSGDSVTITASDPITLDVATPALASLTINSTLDTSGSNYAINVTSGGGTLTIGSGGTLNANGSTITLAGYLYDQLGTFNAGTSTVDFTLNGSTTMIYGSPTFYNLTFAPTLTGTGVYDTNDSHITVSNNLTFNPTAGSSQVLDATMNNTITVGGTISVGGSGSATTIFDTGGDTLSGNKLSISSAGTLTAHGSTINITGSTGTLFADSGTFNAGTSTVNFSGNGSATLTSGTPTFYNLTSSGTGTKSVGSSNITFASGGTLLVSNGTFNSNSNIASSTGATLSVTTGTIVVPTAFPQEYPFGTVTLGTGSTVNYNENSPQGIDNSKTYYNLTVSGTGGWSKTLLGTATVTNTLTMAGDVFDTGGFTLNVGFIAVSGGTFIPEGSTVNLTGTGGTLITQTSGGADVDTATFDLTGNGNATLLSSGNWTFYSLISSGTGTKSLTGGAYITINVPGSFSVTNGTFDTGTGTSNSSGGAAALSVANATLNIGASTFAGNFSGFATPTLGAGSTVNYNAAGAQTIDSTQAYNNLTISGSGTKSLNGTTNVAGALTISAGTLDTTSGGSYTINAASMAENGGIFIPNDSIINLSGIASPIYTITAGGVGTGAPTYNFTGNGDATLNSGTISTCNLNSTGTGTKTLGGNIGMNSACAITVTNGTLTMGTYTASSSGASLSVTNAMLGIGASTLAGNFSGFTTFTFGMGSTVNYNAAGTQTVYNAVPYYNLTVSGGPREVDFPAMGTTTITHAFTANGSAGNLLSLFSTASGTQWTFVPSVSASVSYVNVKDSTCGPGSISYITQSNLTNSGDLGSCWFAAVAPTATVATHSGGGFVPILPAANGSSNLDFTINGGAPVATSPTLALSFNADPNTIAGYAVSLDPAFASGGIRSYAGASAASTFTLPNKSGSYTVYVEYFSPTGNHSPVISHTISYDPSGSTAAIAAVQIANTQGGPFTRVLHLGAQGTEVTALQQLLIKDGELTMPAGASYGYFGKLTETALEAFQAKYAIVPLGAAGSGTFGPKTRAEANTLLGGE